MRKNRLLENLTQSVSANIPMRRYNLADMISESYKMLYQCEEGTNLKRLAESHLDDVRQNPKDIERLSHQLSILKEVSRMVESNDLKDEDLVDEKYYDTVEPKEDRVIVQTECNESDDPTVQDKSSVKRPMRRSRGTQESCTSKKDSIKEADDPELTDEELEELAKHLETIRKERKNAPKTEMTEDVVPRRGIKCHIADSKKTKKEGLKEGGDPNYELQNMVSESLSNALYDVFKSNGLDPEDDRLMQDFYYAVNIDDVVYDTAKFIESHLSKEVKESTSYRGLSNFRKQSESKAFYKTFKKMHESLKEGKALTRQESIDLYKASNSALTQLSIELEHNPEFLDTFKESVSLLSKDVSSLLESLTRGKAPSKATMKSLSKFSEALLCESEETMTSEEAKAYWDENHESDPSLANYDSYEAWYKDSKDNNYIVDPEEEDIEEGQISEEDHPEYLGDFSVVDTKKVGDHEIQICTFTDHEGYGVQVVDKEGNPLDADKEINDLTFDKFFKTEAEAHEVVNKLVPILSTKYSVNESDEDDFIGDDEGDVQSEEADAFDQEYADARVELHKDLEDKHADEEDPEVQEKLAQDAEEVTNLPGVTEEQIAEINGEESTEDDDIEDKPEESEDNSEITDDELEELKKHLKEMRSTKK